VRQIRIERKAVIPHDRDRHSVLPLDLRDPDIARAKLLQRRIGAPHRPARTR
jgi:hypothetical protein